MHPVGLYKAIVNFYFICSYCNILRVIHLFSIMAGSSKKPIYIGSIDEGTTSARFVIFDVLRQKVITFHQIEIKQKHPQEGWVEQDPKEILNAVIQCIEKVVDKLKHLGIPVSEIKAVGITNQRETTVIWDKKTGEPLYNALVWLDMRTTTTLDDILDTIPNKSRNKNYLKPLCGLPLSPYFSALKIRWLMDNVPKIDRAVEAGTCAFGTIDTWLIYNLTGRQLHITDVSNASRTMLMNLETLKWDKPLLRFFQIPQSILPEIKSSSEIYGLISKPSPLAGVPISGCVGDQQGALLGQLCLKPGQAKATYGTGCFLLYNTGGTKIDSTQGLITTVAYKFGQNPPIYALEGSVAIAGAALTWLRDNVQLFKTIPQVQEIAEAVVDTSDLYFVPAFSGLYAPYWQQDARGVICGITEETDYRHIVRASLEAVCFQVRDILEAMVKDSKTKLQAILVDGGMTRNDLLMQLQADLSGIKVIRPHMVESTALGAAILAGIGAGLFDISEIDAAQTTTFTSAINDNMRDYRYSRWKLAIEKSMKWDVKSSSSS